MVKCRMFAKGVVYRPLIPFVVSEPSLVIDKDPTPLKLLQTQLFETFKC